MLNAYARPVVLAASLLLGASVTAQAQDTVINAGTLTCTTQESAPAGEGAVELSCSFESQEGPGSNLRGYIDRGEDAALPASGAVLIWTVKTESASFALGDLSGQYTGESGGDAAKQLRGGKDNAIVLEPVTDTSQIGGTTQATVLNLRLEATET